MASINGLTLKNIVEFKGHEGEPLFQGNIYYNNKKVGFFSQDSWGGEEHVQVDKAVADLFKDYQCKDYDFKGIVWAIYDVCDLLDKEKEYKRVIKKNELASLLEIKVSDYEFARIVINKLVASLDMTEIVCKVKNTFPKYKDFDISAFKLYKSIEDFNITT